MKKIFLIVILLRCMVAGLAQTAYQQPEDLVENHSEIVPGEDPEEKIRNNFFLRASVTSRECFVGEVIMATFKAYSRLEASSRVVRRPSLTGFSVVEMVDAYSSSPEVEKLNGAYYNSHLIRKVQLFPLQPGEYTIEGAEIESTINLYKKAQRGAGSGYHAGPKMSLIRKALSLETQPITVRVKALPEHDKPDGFSGAVGEFLIKVSIDDTSAVQFQPSMVRMEIAGTGNIPIIVDPEISWPAHENPGNPEVSEDLDKYHYPLGGRKIFEYRLLNRDTGSFTIPPVAFSYFDAKGKKYRTVHSQPLQYHVAVAEDHGSKEMHQQAVRKPAFPLHYLYFGLIVLAIAGVIAYQATRKS